MLPKINSNTYKLYTLLLNMATWKTYLIVYFGTNDKPISQIADSVETLGFETAIGPVDFIYEWKSKPTKEQIFELGDKLTEILKGTGTVFNLDTHD